MTRFTDTYLSARIQGYPVEIAPNFSTQQTRVDSGSEASNSRWVDPLRDINVPSGVRDQPTFEALKRHWLVMKGPHKTWPWRDPTDFASLDLEIPNEATADILARISKNDQPLIDADGAVAVPDGIETVFYLGKRYDVGSPAEPYIRRIYFPVVSTIQLAIDGASPAALSPALTATVSRNGGVVTFSSPPGGGSPASRMTWGGLFDLQVRFADDQTFRGIMRTYAASGFADIPLSEVRYCED